MSGIPAGYRLQYNPTELDLVSPAPTTFSLTQAVSALTIHVSTVGGPTAGSTITTTITNTGTGSQDTLDYSGLQAGSVSGGTLTGTLGSGTALALGASAAANQTFQSATAGSFNLAPMVAAATNDTLGGSATLSGSSGATVNVFRLAAANTPGTVNLGSVHVGGAFGTQTLSLQNAAAADGYSEGLDAAFGTPSGCATTNGGTIGLLAPGASDNRSLVVGLGGGANTAAAGAVSGSVPLLLTSDGAGTSGLGTTALAAQTIIVRGSVYSGKAQWNVAGSGSWSPGGNWSDTQGNGAAGTPGVLGYAGDTAAFGNVIGGNSATVAIDAPVTVSALTFDNAAAGYTLSGAGSNTLTLNNSGSGATIAVTSGSHAIAAPMVLADDLTVSGGGTLAIGAGSGISETGSSRTLTMSGTGGALIVNGTNTYSGVTTVNAGQLAVNGSLLSPVTVNSGGILSGTGSLTNVTVNAGGHLAPGNPLGVMNVSGSLDLALGAVMDYDLDGSPADDEVAMPNGLLTLSGQQFSDFNITPQPGFARGSYYLIDAGSISGSLGPSTSGSIDGFSATLAVQGNDLVLNVIPEPSTLALLAAGAVGLAGYVWRRQATRRTGSSGSRCKPDARMRWSPAFRRNSARIRRRPRP